MQKRIDASIKKSTLRAKLKSNQAGFINTEILGEVADYGRPPSPPSSAKTPNG